MEAEARKAFRMTTLEKEEQELMRDILYDEDQLRQTAPKGDQRKELKFALEIARLKLKINGLEIEIENIVTDEERRRKEQQIETNQQELVATKQLLHDFNQFRFSLPQQMAVAQQGNIIHSFVNEITFLISFQSQSHRS